MAKTPQIRATQGRALAAVVVPADATRLTQGRALTAVEVPADETRTGQGAALVAQNFPTPEIRNTFLEPRVVATPDVDVRTTQNVLLVAIKRGGGSRMLRAWTFTQDDHDFYVLHLGDDRTLVLDMMTNQWSTWKSRARNIWRANIGIRWDLDNVAGDDIYGILWNINADARDDDAITGEVADRTPIQTIVRGMFPQRLHNALSCYHAELTLSQGEPVAAGVGVTLRTSDDSGRSWLDHGEILTDVSGEMYDLSWFGLGLITAPGKIFEIIDTGYARRIDALDIDLGSDEGKAGGE